MRRIDPEGLTPPRGYSNGWLSPPGSRLLFVAGQIGWDRDGKIVADDLPRQFRQALDNVLVVVAAAGGHPEHLARLTIYVVDREEYRAATREIGRHYRDLMGDHYPAMALLEVAGLVEPGARVEIEATAAIP
jgi:enamine deaminase RidA (YjgF/YER057c/UK114 family)